ncbi:MAG: SEC-C metal-binding domain-containing protein [Pirellulales bacterium]
MRLSDQQIKEAIAHLDQDVRDAGLFYFADSYSDDTSIMHWAIQAIEKYGWEEAFTIYPYLDTIALDDETLAWVLQKLAVDDVPQSERSREFLEWLSDLLADADLDLLARHEEKLRGNLRIESEVREGIAERSQLRTLDAAELWSQLEGFCRKADESPDDEDISMEHGYRLAEAIVASSDPQPDRILQILRESPADDETSWREIAAVRMAGDLRLEDAIESLVARLHRQSDWVNEESVRALIKIGGDQVLDAIASEFVRSDWGFRVYASVILERIHSERSAQIIREFIDSEEDPEIRAYLGQALLGQFTTDAIEPARQIVLSSPPSRDIAELKQTLLTLATLTGEAIPEADQWREEARRDEEYRSQWSTPEFPVVDASAGYVEQTTIERKTRQSTLPSTWFRSPRVGRNALCPCGSGKKYKKCCLQK